MLTNEKFSNDGINDLDLLVTKRLDFLKKADANLSGENKSWFVHPSNLDIHIVTFIKNLLKLGTVQEALQPKQYDSFEFLNHSIFNAPIFLLEKKTEIESKREVLLSSRSAVLILNVLHIFYMNERKMYQDIIQFETDVARVPKSHLQIGPLTKPPYEYSNEEWNNLECTWQKLFLQSISVFLEFYSITVENVNAKFCFCMAVAIFRMTDKKRIQITSSSFLNELNIFICACYLLAAKLTETLYTSSEITEIFNKILTAHDVQDKQNEFGTDVFLAEKQIASSLDFHLWSPIHISVWCRKNPLEWTIGNVGDDDTLLDLVILSLQNSKIKMICFDLQNFVKNGNVDINEVQDLTLFEFEIPDIICTFFKKLVQAKIFISFVSRFDPLNFVPEEKETKKQAQPTYQTWGSALLSASKKVAQSTKYYATQAATFLISTQDFTINFLKPVKDIVENSLFEKFQKQSCFYEEKEKKKKKSNFLLLANGDTILQVPEENQPSPNALFLSFNLEKYAAIRKKRYFDGENIVTKLWYLFHSKIENLQKFLEEYKLTEKKKNNIYELTFGLTFQLPKDRKTGILTLLNNKTLEKFPNQFQTQFEFDTTKVLPFFSNYNLLEILQNKFLFHLLFSLEFYSELHPSVSISPNQVLFCSQDKEALVLAEQYSFQTFPIFGKWTKEILQTFVVFKKYQTLTYTCTLPNIV